MVRIIDTSRGCFHDIDGSSTCEDVTAIDRLRAALIGSERAQAFDPIELGITPELVEAHRPERSYEDAVTHLQRFVDGTREGFSTTHLLVTVSLDDVEVTSDHNVALMIPWRVTIAGRSWSTYSPAVSHAIAAVLSERGNRALVEDRMRYWSALVWTDFHWRFRLAPDGKVLR